MALPSLTHFTLILSLLTASAVTQIISAPVTLTSEYCPVNSGYATLTACSSWENSIAFSCGPLVTIGAINRQAYSSCYCQRSLYELGTSCVLETQSCSGPDAALEASHSIHLDDVICSNGFAGAGAIATSSPKTSSGRASSGSTKITPMSNPFASSTPAPTSSSEKSSAGAAVNRPMLNDLYLFVGLIVMAALA